MLKGCTGLLPTFTYTRAQLNRHDHQDIDHKGGIHPNSTFTRVKTGPSPAKKGICWQQQRWGVSEKLQAASKHATSRANSKQEWNQVVVTHQKDGTNGSPEQNTRDPARRTTTEGKATKSLGRWCTEMVQWDGNPDDRRKQLGQGETSDCLSIRRRWQKSSTKIK